MIISLLLRRIALLIGIFAVVLTTSPASAKGNGKAKASKEKTETVGKHGREEGQLPYGIERYTDKNDALPSGLEKKKDEDGSLTRGLDDGGKRVSSTTKTTKGRK